MPHSNRLVRKAIFLAVAILAARPACSLADGLQITPLGATLSSSNATSAFSLSNGTGSPALMQLHVKRWIQADGKDQYDDSDDVLAAPPIFNLAQGATQVIRVGLRRQTADPHERAYRLIITQVPAKTPGLKGVSFVVTLSVPIFVQSENAVHGPSLQWSADAVKSDEIRLRVDNSGDVHAHISRLIIYGDIGRAQALYQGTPGAYVLPGQWRSWQIKLARPPAANAVAIDAVLDTGITLTGFAQVK